MVFINEIFKNIIIVADEIKIKRDDLEFLDIQTFLEAYSNLNNQKLVKILKKKLMKIK